MKKLAILISATLLTVAAASAEPQRHERGGRGYDFHGRDYRGFSLRESEVWRGGRWIRDWHAGRFGWWWFVGDAWYFYPEPVYPYPTYVPPVIVERQAPPTPSGLPPAQSWYYCDQPQGYYPYVASCDVPWREVPASPPPTSAPPPSSNNAPPPPPR